MENSYMAIVEMQINLDDDFAKRIGFTSDKFKGYLWLIDDSIYISIIMSLKPGEGNLSKLFNNIWCEGYKIKVPTPFKNMRSILEKKGFKETKEYSKEFQEIVEVWVK
jgi:hypothetical protein